MFWGVKTAELAVIPIGAKTSLETASSHGRPSTDFTIAPTEPKPSFEYDQAVPGVKSTRACASDATSNPYATAA